MASGGCAAAVESTELDLPARSRVRCEARRVLDLYHRRWKGRAVTEEEFVISADEKTQIPIRTRCHPITPPAQDRPIRVEQGYRRQVVSVYIAAWDVHRARLFGEVLKKIVLF